MAMDNDDNKLDFRSIEEGDIPELVDLWTEAYKSKRFLGCFPTHQTERWMRKRFAKRYPEEKLKLSCVAERGGKIVGVLQLTRHGLPVYGSSHQCQPDEMYIESMAVRDDARREGVGSELLHWAETKARATRKIKYLTLEVVRGNPASSLFEKFGFEVVNALDDDCFAYFGSAASICCLFGRPYGMCNAELGYFEMAKDLAKMKAGIQEIVVQEQPIDQLQHTVQIPAGLSLL